MQNFSLTFNFVIFSYVHTDENASIKPSKLLNPKTLIIFVPVRFPSLSFFVSHVQRILTSKS